MAKDTYGDLAADAAAFLAGSANPTEGVGGKPEEIDRQANCLVEWARIKNVILTARYTDGLEKYEGITAEHEVFYRASDDRAVKRTYPGTFGAMPLPNGSPGHTTPLFYLRRIGLMNWVFDSDFRLEGLAMGKSPLIGAVGDQPSIVISQPWIRPANAESPHPSELEIGRFMESLGFRSLEGAYFGWHRDRDGVTVTDARPDNFIASPHGVVPIDLVIAADPESNS